MGKGIRVGRIFGIDIHVDWSWLLIFVLVTWNLVAGFGNWHPEWSTALTWGVALAASLLFFGSVLAHELAHSLVARAQGLPVRRIVLFLFGGVSDIQRHPPSARAEFLIAVVGPVTSIALGLIFSIASGVGGDLQARFSEPQVHIGQLGPIATLLLWLGPINILLGVFNLIPGFPLDGGRILRSILWVSTGDLRRATLWASLVGQGIAWVMIFAGVAMVFGARIPILGTGLVSGLWLAFIGWFLNTASSQSYQRLVLRDALQDVPVSAMMRTDPPSVSPEISISQLVDQHLMRRDEQSFPVMEGDRIVGLITLQDVRGVSRDQWDTTLVRQVMTPAEKFVTVADDTPADEVLSKLSQRDVRQLPVLRDGQLVGVVRRKDIVRWLQLNSDVIEAG